MKPINQADLIHTPAVDTIELAPSAIEVEVSGANTTKIKPKTNKFVALMEHALNAVFVCSVVWVGMGYDKFVPENMEAIVFGKSEITGEALEMKQSFALNHPFLIEKFKNDANIERIKNLNIRTRVNFSLSSFDSKSKEAHSYPIYNYINVSIPSLVNDYEQSTYIKKKVADNLAAGIPSNKTVKEYFFTKNGGNLLYNYFLNLETNQRKLVPDYFYFHEFSHTYFDNRLKSIEAEIKKDFAINGIEYRSNNERVIDESMSDILGVILTIDKHNLDSANSIELIEAVMAQRFVSRVMAKTITKEAIKHDTEFALWSLLQEIKHSGIESFKSKAIEEKVALAIDYGKRSMYYSNFTSQENLSEKEVNVLAQKSFPKEKIDSAFDSYTLFDDTGRDINKLAQKSSFFIKTVLQEDLQTTIKKVKNGKQ